MRHAAGVRGSGGDAAFVIGGGETGSVIRSIDWRETPLGPASAWPQSLRTALGICLDARFPSALCWGAAFVMLYNDALIPIVGGDRHPAAMGRPAFEALPELRAQIEPLLALVHSTGEPVGSDELTLPIVHGQAREASYTAFTFSPVRDESGAIGGVFCAAVETTDKVLEGRRRRLNGLANAASAAPLYRHFMQAPFPVAVLRGPDHVVALANPEMLRAWGAGPEVVGRALGAALPGFRDSWVGPLDDVFRTGLAYEATARHAGRPTRPDVAPEDRYVNFTYTPLRDPTDAIEGVLVSGFDVTDQVRARSLSEQAVIAAEAARATQRAASEFQERFVAVLGHDLRNPLGAIAMAAGVLKQQAVLSSNPVTARIVGRIDSSATRMSRMIEQILDLSRSRVGGGIEVSPAVMDLRATLAAVVDELHTAHPSRTIELRCAAIVGTWDRDRLEQVFSNLVGNAIHHGAADAPIAIAVHASDAGIQVEVHNEGPAIPEDVRETLFDPFRRGADDRRSTKSAGLGLGLYIARELVTAHGGRLEVRSTATEGTTFSVWLPYHRGS